MKTRRGSVLTLAAVLLAGWVAASAGVGGVVEAEVARLAPTDWELDGDLDSGLMVYKQYCQKCHGKRGNGQGLMAKDLEPKPSDFTDGSSMHKRSDWEIYLGIKEGGPPVGLSSQMTAWEDTLMEEEMHDVAVFIRSFAPKDGE